MRGLANRRQSLSLLLLAAHHPERAAFANLFGNGLIAALLAKQASSPPLAPVDIDAVRWPEEGGTVGRIFWRAPDVSGNNWILAYDIEQAPSPRTAASPTLDG